MTGAAVIFMFDQTALPMLPWEGEHEKWAAKMESEEVKWHVADQPINEGDDRVALFGITIAVC